MIFVVIPPNTGDPLQTGLSPDSFPTALCSLISFLAAFQIVKGLRQGLILSGEKQLTFGHLLHMAKYFLLMALVFPAWKYLGFIPGSMLVLLSLLLASGERKPTALAVTTVSAVLLVYCAITYGLNVPVPYM